MKNTLTMLAVQKVTEVTTKNANGETVTDADPVANIAQMISIVIGVLGIVAVIVIIIGGVGYMTSTGDAGKTKKAKDTILGGVIGLIICALAFAIVNFVIANVINKA